jgi:AraC-like DNA-binding protein
MLNYKEFLPSPQLASFIECYWTLQSSSEVFQKNELIIPGGRAEIIFSFNNSFDWYNRDNSFLLSSSKSFVLGQRDTHFYANSKGEIDLIGVRFKIGGISAFLDNPVNEITNAFPSLDDLFGNPAKEWNEKVNFGKSISDKISAIEDFLITRLKVASDHLLFSKANNQIKNLKEGVSIAGFCKTSGIHYKKLERTFLKISGYMPKSFSRIARFYNAIYLAKHSSLSLTEISYTSNYYDQSHFIRDCKEFAGSTPGILASDEHKLANLLLRKLPV